MSPLSATAVAAGGLRLGVVGLDGDDLYWLEGRPSEGGRYALVKRTPDGTIADVTPRDMNVRSRVHEYGGDAYLVADGVVYFSNFADQRVYRLVPGQEAQAITPVGAWFYADFVLDTRRQRLIGVREDHTGQGREPVNTIVSIPLASNESAGEVIASGYDFYSTPRLSPDGSMLAWLSWRHPNMPWDGTELWVAAVTAAGALEHHRQIAGGPSESIYQPGWSPDGILYYVSDRSGYWRLYRSERSGRSDRSVEVVRGVPVDAEFGRPQWVFGTASWAFAGGSRLVVSYTRRGTWQLATVDVASGEMTNIAPQTIPHDWMTANATHAVLVAGSAIRPDANSLPPARIATRLQSASASLNTCEPKNTVQPRSRNCRMRDRTSRRPSGSRPPSPRTSARWRRMTWSR